MTDRGTRRLILASGSPRRRDLLRAMGLPFEVVPPRLDESSIEGGEARERAERLAAAKARDVAGRAGPGIVIGADTLVALDGAILGKPDGEEDARRILRALSGSRHAVVSGLCVLEAPAGREWIASETTWVTMRAMPEEAIEAYVASGEAMGKAGAYAIQETGDRHVERIEGSFTNVVGLPTERLARILEEGLGLRVPVASPLTWPGAGRGPHPLPRGDS